MSNKNDLPFNNAKSDVSPYILKYIDYQISGLSLNHIVGCPLDCSYCVRHFWGNFDMKKPQLLCSDNEAIDSLLNHPFFFRDKTPIHIFNKATDPFLPQVKSHLFYILERLDREGLKNLVLLITRYKVSNEDIKALEKLKNLKISLFITYSGIQDAKIEPLSSTNITLESIKTIAVSRKKTRAILYWRPIVLGWNDDDDSISRTLEAAKKLDGIVFTGYYNRPENSNYLIKLGINPPYKVTDLKKILPQSIEKKILFKYKKISDLPPLFRKTSCAAAYVHGMPDYNGHRSIKKICDICPLHQLKICDSNLKKPSQNDLSEVLKSFNFDCNFKICSDHIDVSGLSKEQRYALQHHLNYQVWDADSPEFHKSHNLSYFARSNNEFD